MDPLDDAEQSQGLCHASNIDDNDRIAIKKHAQYRRAWRRTRLHAPTRGDVEAVATQKFPTRRRSL
jgi:hypothetical protein